MKTKQLLLSLLALLGSTTLRAYDACVNNIYYNFTEIYGNGNGYAHVTYGDYHGGSYTGDVVIPEDVTYNSKTYSVVSIDDEAFNTCRGLKSVTIPNSVTQIGQYAFYSCSSLIGITIPSSVTLIGREAFKGCSSLNSIIVESGNTIFDSRNNCNAIIQTETNTLITGCKNTIIPESVTDIISYAFLKCNGLTSITIPKNIMYIGRGAFEGCADLTSIIVSNENRFYDSRNNCNAIIETATNTLIAGCMNTIIPESVTSIGDEAFYGCTGLTSITIPNSVTSIGDEAFYDCTGLTGLVIPESVTSIGYLALSGTAWNADVSEGVVYAGKVAYCYTGTKPSGTLTLKEGTLGIAQRAFQYCSNLTSVIIPNSVKNIGMSAFDGCSNLSSVSIGNNVTEVGRNAFSGTAWYNNQPDGLVYVGSVAYEYKGYLPENTDEIVLEDGTLGITAWAFSNSGYRLSGLKSIVFPNSLTNIGEFAFLNSNLTSITIPEGVTYIYACAFYGCRNLTSVVSLIKKPFTLRYVDNTFWGISSNCVLTVPYGTRDAYIAAGWTEEVFKGGIVEAASPSPIITFTDANVKALCVANWDTNGDGELSEAEAAAVTDLGEVFRSNTTITSFNELKYFTSLTTIGNNAFDGCTSLTSIAIPASLNRVKAEAFKNCTSLSKVIVTDIAAWCGIIYDITSPWEPLGNFPLGLALHLYSDENTEITEVVIPEGVTRIEPLAFRDAKYVTSVTIPNSVTYIGEQAFSGMHRLTSITIPQNVTTLGQFTFKDCQSLTSFTIPEGVVNMEGNVFRDCTSLTSVSLPESLKVLGGHTFIGCRNLTSITIPDGITHLSRIAFEGCSSLTTFTYNKAENALTKVNGVYQIGTAEDLCNFAILSTAANSDISAQLTADIDYTGYTFLGSNVGEHFQYIGLNGYCGTFDGNGHTITVDINNPDSWAVAALFRELGKGGVIKNLRVAGHVESVSKFSAGIVSNLKSGKVSHCVSDVDIISHIDGDCTDGGIAGIATYDGEESIVEYCVVAGSFQGSNAHHRGGIIGIGYGGNSDNITIDNCLFLANVDGLDVTESGTFIRQPTDKTTINNCYYLNVLGTVTSGTQTTTAQMTSGELCFLLNGDQSNIDWTQNLTGDAVDSYPLPFSTHAQVYAYGNTYSNNDLSPIITFADANVKAICVANWDTNGDGELSEAEAAAVTDLGTVFKYNTTITSFNELQYFTGLTSIGDYAFYNCSNLTFVTMPESAISIGNFSFHGCNNLSSFIIPEGVAILGENSFEECFSLPSITIPRTVTSIGRNAFTSTNFDSIVVDEGNTVYDSRDNCNAIVETESNTLISGCENTIIPIGVTSIGTEAFSGRSGLTSITIPNSVSSIDFCAFWGTGLTDVFCYANDVPSADYAFENSSISTATLHVPAASLEAYRTTAPWSAFGTIVPIDGFVINDETTSLNVVTEESGKAVIFTHDFNGEWEALYLPFAINYDDIKADFDLAEIDGVVQNDQNNDGIADITVLSIIGFKGQHTTPNKPYLIRAKNAGNQTINFEDVTVYPTEELTFDCASFSTKYDFTGSYYTLNASALANRYVVQGGELVKGASSLAPCRWYMTATARNGAPLNLPNRIRIMPVEDVITGVEDLNTNVKLRDSLFDLQGRKVTNPQKGIYIQNGKKVALK